MLFRHHPLSVSLTRSKRWANIRIEPLLTAFQTPIDRQSINQIAPSAKELLVIAGVGEENDSLACRLCFEGWERLALQNTQRFRGESRKLAQYLLSGYPIVSLF